VSVSTPTEESAGREAQGRFGQTDPPNADEITVDHQNARARTLTPQQLAAIELLIAGRSDVEVAAKVGVTRETVNRWRNWNPLFVATLNEWRLDLWKATRERLRHLNAQALDVIEQHLRAGNLKAALALLKYAHDEKFPNGSTNVPDVIDDFAENFNLTVLLREMRASYRDHPLVRGLRRDWLGEGDGKRE
jgi:hypothetical protein